VELNSQRPYKVEQSENIYHFTTISGVSYIAYFIEIDSAEINNLYSFSFETDSNNTPFDPRTSVTVIKILQDFFENHQNSMLFVCDVSDGKQQARLRLFDQWYKQHGQHQLVKIDHQEKLPDYQLLASLLFSKNHPEKDKILAHFHGFIDSMRY
jgi:hypothetical protein